MKFIEWSKKNYLIVILFILAVLVLAIKINIRIKEDKISSLPTKPIPEKVINNLISPTPIIIKKNTYGNKTREEILEMDGEDRDDFITQLSREEVEELDMMPNYDFSDFLPYKDQNFIIEKFDHKNKKLTVKPLIQDKTKIKEEVSDWLFYSNGNNPKKIEIIWNE